MGDNLVLLEEKIQRVLSLVERLRQENSELHVENESLRNEVAEFRQLNRKLKLTNSDQSDVIRTKLQSVLSRVAELEELKL
jgi:hypothetical protein